MNNIAKFIASTDQAKKIVFSTLLCKLTPNLKVLAYVQRSQNVSLNTIKQQKTG